MLLPSPGPCSFIYLYFFYRFSLSTPPQFPLLIQTLSSNMLIEEYYHPFEAARRGITKYVWPAYHEKKRQKKLVLDQLFQLEFVNMVLRDNQCVSSFALPVLRQRTHLGANCTSVRFTIFVLFHPFCSWVFGIIFRRRNVSTLWCHRHRRMRIFSDVTGSL